MKRLRQIFSGAAAMLFLICITAGAQETTWDFDSVVEFCNPTACSLGGVQTGDPFRGYIKANTQPNSNVALEDVTDFLLLLGNLSADAQDGNVAAINLITDENGDFESGFIQLEGTISGLATLLLTFDIVPATWTIETDFLGIGLVASGSGSWTFELDGDGLAAIEDNCTEMANADQRDTDGDGIGNACDPDFDQNCSVNFPDLSAMAANFFLPGNLDTDLDGDGQTNFADLNIMSPLFFAPPGPSGVPNVCEP